MKLKDLQKLISAGVFSASLLAGAAYAETPAATSTDASPAPKATAGKKHGKSHMKPKSASVAPEATSKADHSCAGKNGCKGKGGCQTSDMGCKGKNSCKGKGGCASEMKQ